MMSTQQADPFFRREPADHRIKNVVDYLHNNMRSKIGLKDLSGIALLSPCHLLRVFKKAVGITPKEYLLRLRVETTKQLLRQGVPLSDIVRQTGFTDKSHLARTFRKVTGITPDAFRRGRT
jgi:transcriptional regulator GlxA family with amidase domain